MPALPSRRWSLGLSGEFSTHTPRQEPQHVVKVPKLRFTNQDACSTFSRLRTVKAGQMVLNDTSRRTGKGSVVEFTVAGAVEEAIPLIAVEDEHALIRIARDAHQDPVRAVDRGFSDLDRAVAGS